MDYRKGDSPSRRQQLRQIAKQTGKEFDFEDDVILDEIRFYHSMFFEVWDSYKGLTYQNIYYYQKLFDVYLQPQEIEMFKGIAGKCNEYVAGKTKKPKKV